MSKFTAAQIDSIYKPSYINFKIDDSLKDQIFNSLELMFKDIKLTGKSVFVDQENHEITYNLLNSLWRIEYNNSDSFKQLINAYRINKDKYLLKIAYLSKDKNEVKIHSILSILAKVKNKLIAFSSPINYFATNWKYKKVGNINYYYNGYFDKKVAINFDKNNSLISIKLDVPTEELNFYKCSNYQEVLDLIGLDYLMKSNGKLESSKIVGNTIITGLNSEDFSHDIFHFYSSKLFEKKDRNWIAEEGIAYSWGNAYYTNTNNKMISHKELVILLKQYLKDNPQENLLSLFENKPKIFNELSPFVSVRSTIAGLLSDEVERKKGIKGVKKLISSGKGEDNFFKAINELIDVSKVNFDYEVIRLLESY